MKEHKSHAAVARYTPRGAVAEEGVQASRHRRPLQWRPSLVVEATRTHAQRHLFGCALVRPFPRWGCALRHGDALLNLSLDCSKERGHPEGVGPDAAGRFLAISMFLCDAQ
jgi:hypothetical protein